jgi:hypothetical protein
LLHGCRGLGWGGAAIVVNRRPVQLALDQAFPFPVNLIRAGKKNGCRLTR